jgi:hypothetical protein
VDDMIQRLLVILVCSVVVLDFGSRASAAVLSSHADASSAVLSPAGVHESNKCSWLWRFLNPWTSDLSVGLDSRDACPSVLEIIGNGMGGGSAGSSSEERANAVWDTLVNGGVLFPLGISEFLGSTHSTASSSSSAPASGSAAQAGLPVKMEVLCFKTVGRLIAEGSFLNARDYISSLFRPPRCLA